MANKMRDGKILLIEDLKRLDEMIAHCYYGTNCSIHVGRVLARAEGGFYHLVGDDVNE